MISPELFIEKATEYIKEADSLLGKKPIGEEAILAYQKKKDLLMKAELLFMEFPNGSPFLKRIGELKISWKEGQGSENINICKETLLLFIDHIQSFYKLSSSKTLPFKISCQGE